LSSPLATARRDAHIAAMTTRTRKPRGSGRVIEDDKVEILPPKRGLAVDWRRLLPPVAFGTAAGFIASLVVGGGGFLRHAVVGLLGMLVGQGIVRVTAWRISTGSRFADDMAMAVIGAILVVLLARFIA
jgi:uncharacterized membrane protein YeaQ/YmgE (transglycosylase-associated protein family)